jgi:hypothetical protein
LQYFYVSFLTLLAQKIIHTARKNYWISERHQLSSTTTFEADLLSEPSRAFELIPEADPKQRRRRRGRWSDLQVILGRCAHYPPLLSILLANVQSLDNKVVDIRARVAFQRDIRNSNILFHGNMALSGYAVRVDSLCVAPTGINISPGRRVKAGFHD